MALSGPGGTWRARTCLASDFEPERVRVYYVDGTWVDSWDGPAEGVAGVVVSRGDRHHWTANADEYLAPTGRSLLGAQLGEVDGQEWVDFWVWMRAHGEGRA